ncbi:MAG TPA: hypothetical protein VEW48_09070 [Thermoanaerobaculia bacterium]|nr:hypothetical protein [Thermoanaerobaculia bacterium]
MPRKNLGTIATSFAQLLAALDTNAADFTHVDAERQELQALLPALIAMSAEQAALNAQTQQKTKDLNERLDRGLVLFAQLRSAVKAKYTTRSEKLTEFHLRPLTRRRIPPGPKVEAGTGNPADPAAEPPTTTTTT